MKKCTYTAHCASFLACALLESGMADLIREDYCHANHSRCARYVIARELGGLIPESLMPEPGGYVKKMTDRLREQQASDKPVESAQ